MGLILGEPKIVEANSLILYTRKGKIFNLVTVGGYKDPYLIFERGKFMECEG